MSLTSRLVAIQGIGLSAIALAVQGLLEILTQPPVDQPIAMRPSVMGRGPGVTINLSDYLQQFKRPPASLPTPPMVNQAQARKKRLLHRQRMEEEVMSTCEII
jgi:hypothetical protein